MHSLLILQFDLLSHAGVYTVDKVNTAMPWTLAT